jgi:serine/threonine protein kinase
VAVKVPHPRIQNHSVWSKKFLRERRMLANASHPNVVSVLWTFAVNGTHALAMEYVADGKPLSSTALGAPATRVDQVSVNLQIMHGLRAIHDAGIVHRQRHGEELLSERTERGSFVRVDEPLVLGFVFLSLIN